MSIADNLARVRERMAGRRSGPDGGPGRCVCWR